MITKMEYVDCEKNMANKYYARIDFGDFVQSFKFQEQPTLDEIMAKAQIFKDNYEKQLEEQRLLDEAERLKEPQ